MKITAISGSPRKGNTYKMLKFIEEKYPGIDYKVYSLKDTDLKRCTGCYQCISQGEDRCPHKDDRDKIIEDMMASDGVIFASPVYTNHVSGTMKDFLDRISYFAHRPAFFGKQAMIVSVAAGFGAENSTDYMKGIASVFGFNVASTCNLLVASGRKDDVESAQGQVIDAMDQLIESIRISKTKAFQPSITQLVYFNIFKGISAMTRETNPADYAFYKDTGDFVIDVQVPFFKKFIAKRAAASSLKKAMSRGKTS